MYPQIIFLPLLLLFQFMCKRSASVLPRTRGSMFFLFLLLRLAAEKESSHIRGRAVGGAFDGDVLYAEEDIVGGQLSPVSILLVPLHPFREAEGVIQAGGVQVPLFQQPRYH